METKRDDKQLDRRAFLTQSGMVAAGVGVGAVGLNGALDAKAAELLNLQLRGEFVVSDFEKSECSGCHVMGENYESGQFIIGKGNNCTDCHGSDPHGDTELAGSL